MEFKSGDQLNLPTFVQYDRVRILLFDFTGTPRRISDASLHEDLNISTVKELASSYYKIFPNNLYSHISSLTKNMSSLTLPENPVRRPQKNWSRDLLK